MSFTVSLLWRAERDLDRIIARLVERSPQGASAWLDGWDRVVETLEQSAEAHGWAPENVDLDLDIRQVLFRTPKGRGYRALYTIREARVYVMHIRGPGQDLVPPDQMGTVELE